MLRTLASAYGHLGRKAEALDALEKMYRLVPQFTLESFRRVNSPALVERRLEGWRLAGWVEPPR